jgi:hypothetical protein
MRHMDPFDGLTSDLAPPADDESYDVTDAGEWGEGLLLAMFRDDFALLMERRRPGDSPTVSAAESVADVIAAGLPSRYGPLVDLRTAVPDFIHSVAYELLDGPVTFDVEYFRRPGTDHPVMFRLLRRWEAAASQHTRLHPLPAGAPESVQFDLPAATRTLLTKARPLWIAAGRSSDTAVRFTGDASIGYDFDYQQRSISEYVLQRTWDIGWDGRGTFSDGLLDPMKVALRLRFVRLQITVRDHLLGQLQTHLRAVGDALHADFTLTFDGLSREDDVRAAERSLQAGDAKISDLLRLQP